jgi:rhamnose transport system permease protein
VQSLEPTRRSPVQPRAPFSWRAVLLRWEWILLALLILTMTVDGGLSKYFWDPFNLGDSTQNFSEKGIMALGMALLILCREIDLSVAATMALCSLCMGYAAQGGAGGAVLLFVGLTVGGLCGAVNAALVIGFRVPSIVVTIGTMSLFRGIAQGVLGDQALTRYPADFAVFGQGYTLKYLPLEFVFFCVLTLLVGVVLHRTRLGRYLYAIGNNPEAASFSGIPVQRLRAGLFIFMGIMAGFAAVCLTSRIGSTRPNIAQGWELDVITMVVLGGISIAGGSGSILGVFLAVLTLGMIIFGMGLLNIPGIVASVIIGSLMIVTIALPRLLGKVFKDKRSA